MEVINKNYWKVWWEAIQHGHEIKDILYSVGPDQMESKIHLVDCIPLDEMKKFNDLKIHLYGGWYGYPLINLLLTKFLNIEHITNIDMDEKALDLSRKYTQALELEHKVFFKHRDVKDKIETSYYKDKDVRLVINTSSEHMADLPDLIANKDYTPNCVFALQSNNMFHVKDQHINCSNNLDEFIKKTGLTKIWFADTYKMSNGYERYTVIGNLRT